MSTVEAFITLIEMAESYPAHLTNEQAAEKAALLAGIAAIYDLAGGGDPSEHPNRTVPGFVKRMRALEG